jgi:hypothetical protein
MRAGYPHSACGPEFGGQILGEVSLSGTEHRLPSSSAMSSLVIAVPSISTLASNPVATSDRSRADFPRKNATKATRRTPMVAPMPIPVFCPTLKMCVALSDGAADAAGSTEIGDGSEPDELPTVLDCRVVVMLVSVV